MPGQISVEVYSDESLHAAKIFGHQNTYFGYFFNMVSFFQKSHRGEIIFQNSNVFFLTCVSIEARNLGASIEKYDSQDV